MAAGLTEGWEPAFWTVFSQTRNAMILLDQERSVVDANPAFEELLGHPRDEILGRSFYDFIPPDEHEDHRLRWEDLQVQREATVRRTLVKSDGSRVIVQYAGVLTEVPERGPLGVYVAIDVEAEPEEAASAPSETDIPSLTAREHDVVRLVALGQTGVEIAGELGVSPETVRTHVRNAMAKTGTRTRAQLVATAFAEQLI
jgi:PAS domain S-box-containing protein